MGTIENLVDSSSQLFLLPYASHDKCYQMTIEVTLYDNVAVDNVGLYELFPTKYLSMDIVNLGF